MRIQITRLPDINSRQLLPPEYDNYGRFGKTVNGNFYVHGICSSHDSGTLLGGYWAINRKDGILYLSPRGVLYWPRFQPSTKLA